MNSMPPLEYFFPCIEIVLLLHFLNNQSVAARRKAQLKKVYIYIYIYFFFGGGDIYIKGSFGNNLWIELYLNAYWPNHTHSFHVFVVS